ncbi:Serine/threonine-protein kinase PrkC [Posidoniimonas corsicana]|uniref:non-specific serine/threonine protein kinase n=1 Tax=Posidoniimonas corsicana TaxID=1938618 RepID=A0A5C5V507_9BACT|nr:serine/threonine-protein kinase [Posidoniimonas corsicana]TWT33626.1 Serine/threonine-protein kinase PrkC [Posidoniimonas corsicana]
MQDYTGQQIGDYLVLRRLGRGAMADVYLAEQQSLGRQIALKILKSDLASDATYVSRFQHEARSAAKLVHANIVQVYEVGRSGDAHFIAQEYVSGKNLGELVQQQGRLQPGVVLDILRQSAAALHRAQEVGVVHRDIKPENLMLTQSGELKVADFGLARVSTPTEQQLTQVGVTMGTPLYMSPEQIEGRPVDARSDLYSLGVTAYHLLSGEAPFRGETPLAVAVQHLNNRATPLADTEPDMPVRLSQVVEKLMAKEPGHRYQTPADLLADLRELARQAADEGWADGPEHWTAVDLSVLRDGHAATQELDQLMKQASALSLGRSPWGRRVAVVAALLMAGGLVGMATQPAPLLSSERTLIEERDDVLSQLYFAKQVDTEAAWKAVKTYFSEDLDVRHEMMADQGLARLYLGQGRYEEARDVCLRLYDMAGDSDPYVRRFAAAGLTVAFVGMEYWDQAREAAGQFLAADDLIELEQLEPQLYRMFNEALERLDSQGSTHAQL